MVPNILITGVTGFLGRSAAAYFSSLGYSVYGISRANISDFDPEFLSLFSDIKCSHTLSIDFLLSFNVEFKYILHASGNSSVSESFLKPEISFNSTVNSLFIVLEFMRLYNQNACLLYPSSAAVYGASLDSPLLPSQQPNPVSPYGFHKCIAESLLQQYSSLFNLRTICVRFFSIYGIGLRKQLIWDVCNKCLSADNIEFYGEGTETRDWICIDDALHLISKLFNSYTSYSSRFILVNGASGIRTTNSDLIALITSFFDPQPTFCFNGVSRPGDPKYYWADMSAVKAFRWSPNFSLSDGISAYVSWFKELYLCD